MDSKDLRNFLGEIDSRQAKDLIKDQKKYETDWTEEVIIPEIIYEKLANKEQLSWNKCNLDEIYQPSDIRDIFGVEPSSLNTSYSKRFYKLSEGELQKWNELGKKINTSLRFNDVLIIYSK